jgi:hypothetical protein
MKLFMEMSFNQLLNVKQLVTIWYIININSIE